MRSYHVACLIATLPGILQSQPKKLPEQISRPFDIVPPGVVVRVEKFDALQAAGTQIAGMVVDKKGFLWCRTNKGLARFDGHDLTMYQEDPADTAGVFRMELQAVAVDSEGFVWRGTPNGGLGRLDPSTGRSRWYRGRDDDSTSIGTGATRLLVTSDGQLWAGAKHGLAVYDRSSDSFVRHPLPPEVPPIGEGHVPMGYIITSLCELDRSIWAGLIGAGLAEFNRDTGKWKIFAKRGSTTIGPSNETIRAVCPDRTGRLWIGAREFGLDCYTPRTGAWDHFSVTEDGISTLKPGTAPVRSHVVWAIAEDDFGGIWISTIGGGIYRYDPGTGSSSHYRHDSTDANSIPSDFLLWLGVTSGRHESVSASVRTQPSYSIIWVPPFIWGGFPYGIGGTHRAIVRRDPCTSVLYTHREGSPVRVVNALSRDSSGAIWVGIYNGVTGSFDLTTRTVTSFPGPSQGILQLAQLRDGTFIATSRLASETWLLDPRSTRWARILPELHVTCVREENDSLIWLGCVNRSRISYITAFSRRNGTYIAYPRQDPDSASYLEDAVTRMCSDGAGGLWYGTAGGGLIRFDVAQKMYRRYTGNPGSDNTLTANGVAGLVPDSAGKLWVGTHAGLALMDCAQGTFEHIHSALQESGEPLIRDMVDDGEGHLWIAAEEGAICFTKSSRTFRLLTPPPRFRNSGFWSVMYEPRTRTVYIGGLGGFFMFPVDDPPAATFPPPVVLTSFRVFEKPYPLDGEVWSLRSITIPQSASFFSFTFAALDYLNPVKAQYAYRLEGFDPEWIQAGSRRYAGYTNLDPGTYVFSVRAATGEGIWNEKGTSIEIIVLPPWYRTSWAYGAYALLAGGLLFMTWRFDQRRTALKNDLRMKSFEAAKMREVDGMKSAFFANISHEFRTPLTLILGPLEQFAERFQDDERARSTISTMRINGLRLLQLINQLLDLSRVDAGKMAVRVRPVDLVALSRALIMSFQTLADRKKVGLIFDPEEHEVNAYADRDKFEKILTNLLSNAFKFTGEGGEITVVLRIVEGKNGARAPSHGRRVEIVVSDSGIGIGAEHIDKVFNRFYQVESSQMQENGGTGIGLALTKELVELLRGEITVRSAPGRGSTFIIRLPIEKEAWRPEEIAVEEAVPESAATDPTVTAFVEGGPGLSRETPRESGKPVVLVVEDNPDVRTYVRGFLEKHFTVEEAENGKRGLEKARDKGIDLVISDIMMPVMDGVQLCRELKGDERTSHIPVVLLTARATSEGKIEGLDVGADDYVVKPFDARELMARVRNLIDTRKKLWEKYHRQVTLGPADIPVDSADERFLKRLAENIERHVADAEYDTESVAHDMCMSRMQLNRKLNALTGKSTHEVVREFRLQRAAELLRKRSGNIAGVAYDVGFSSLSHFARAFRERFGVVPSEYSELHPGGEETLIPPRGK